MPTSFMLRFFPYEEASSVEIFSELAGIKSGRPCTRTALGRMVLIDD
jgi:hypothetical protein